MRAGSKLTVPEYVLIKITCALLPVAVLLLLHQALIGVALGALCFFLPDVDLRRRRRRRRKEFGEQLPDTLDLIVGSLRAGFSLQHSLANVAKQAQEPTATEFQRIGQEMQLGLPLLAALDNLVRRIESEDLEMLVSVFKIHSRVGGNLAAILETVSTTIRERVKLRREVQVLTSMQRFSGYVIGGLPIVLAVILYVINPGYMGEIFHWNKFLCLPVFSFIMMVIGFLVIRKLVDIKV
jgi:tight adherence protein B